MNRLESQHAIETTYRKYNFRSRLEAKWAVFFDLCKWSWAYEPLDLPGWIPDFAIGERPTLVEIKPFFHREEWSEAIDKIIRAKYLQDVVLLGADPVMLAGEVWSFDAPQLGWIVQFERSPNGPVFHVSDLHFGFTEGNDRFGLCPMDAGWSNVIWKAPDVSHPNKWSRVCLGKHEAEKSFRYKWADACNVARWVPTSPTPPEQRKAVGQ